MSSHTPDPNASSNDEGQFPQTDHDAGAGMTGGGFTDSGAESAGKAKPPAPSKGSNRKFQIAVFSVMVALAVGVAWFTWAAYKKPVVQQPITASLGPAVSPLAGAPGTSDPVSASDPAVAPPLAPNSEPNPTPDSGNPLQPGALVPDVQTPATPDPAPSPLSPVTGAQPPLAAGASSPVDPLAALAAGSSTVPAPIPLPAASVPTLAAPVVQLEVPRAPPSSSAPAAVGPVSGDAASLRTILREELAPLTRRVEALEQSRAGAVRATAPPVRTPTPSASAKPKAKAPLVLPRPNRIEVLSRPTDPPIAPLSAPAHNEAEAPAPRCDLQGVVAGRAWVKNAEGGSTAYAVQDAWVDGTPITAIDPAVGIKGAGRLLCALGHP